MKHPWSLGSIRILSSGNRLMIAGSAYCAHSGSSSYSSQQTVTMNGKGTYPYLVLWCVWGTALANESCVHIFSVALAFKMLLEIFLRMFVSHADRSESMLLLTRHCRFESELLQGTIVAKYPLE